MLFYRNFILYLKRQYRVDKNKSKLLYALWIHDKFSINLDLEFGNYWSYF